MRGAGWYGTRYLLCEVSSAPHYRRRFKVIAFPQHPIHNRRLACTPSVVGHRRDMHARRYFGQQIDAAASALRTDYLSTAVGLRLRMCKLRTTNILRLSLQHIKLEQDVDELSDSPSRRDMCRWEGLARQSVNQHHHKDYLTCARWHPDRVQDMPI